MQIMLTQACPHCGISKSIIWWAIFSGDGRCPNCTYHLYLGSPTQRFYSFFVELFIFAFGFGIMTLKFMPTWLSIILGVSCMALMGILPLALFPLVKDDITSLTPRERYRRYDKDFRQVIYFLIFWVLFLLALIFLVTRRLGP